MLGIAINIKMSAILLVPGFLLVIAFERGLIRSLLTLVILVMVQIFIGLEFLLVNPKAYLNMSYNFERQFVKREQVNFQFLTEEFMHSKIFNTFLVCGHVGFLLAFLLFKWTGMDSSNTNPIMRFFEDVRAWPINRLLVDDVLDDFREINQYKSLLIIFTCNFIGMAFSRGYH